MSQNRAPSDDPRWGDHLPWSLRYEIIHTGGNWLKFFALVGQRFFSLVDHNEAGIGNHSYFLEKLSSESLGRFVRNRNVVAAHDIEVFFSTHAITNEISNRTKVDPIAFTDKQKSTILNMQTVLVERVEVLQSLLILLPHHQKIDVLPSLVRDIRRFSADTNISLNIQGHPPIIVPIEEPLLQKEVLDKLMPRLETRFPERAADLLKAYHDLLKDVDTNTVFGNAFKALEELAREITSDKNLELSDRAAIGKAFPNLHPTIQQTIIKLAAHRGDEAGHGRKGPDVYEIRYLLFSICNMALLLLEHQQHRV